MSNRLARCPWDKHDGVKWETVVVRDRDYVEWLVGGEGPPMEEELYDFLTELLENTEDDGGDR